MIIERLNWRILAREMPITSVLIIFMSALCLGYWLRIVPPFISMPGVLNESTWLAHFFHISPFHLISNLLIALLAGSVLERDLGKISYILLVALILNLLVIFLFYFNTNPILGFSGVGMGLISFAALFDWNIPHNRKLFVSLIIINVLFGLFPGISWYGHFFGAVSGLLAFGVFYLTGLIKR